VSDRVNNYFLGLLFVFSSILILLPLAPLRPSTLHSVRYIPPYIRYFYTKKRRLKFPLSIVFSILHVDQPNLALAFLHPPLPQACHIVIKLQFLQSGIAPSLKFASHAHPQTSNCCKTHWLTHPSETCHRPRYPSVNFLLLFAAVLKPRVLPAERPSDWQ
jgi:hypothetical protein